MINDLNFTIFIFKYINNSMITIFLILLFIFHLLTLLPNIMISKKYENNIKLNFICLIKVKYQKEKN